MAQFKARASGFESTKVSVLLDFSRKFGFEFEKTCEIVSLTGLPESHFRNRVYGRARRAYEILDASAAAGDFVGLRRKWIFGEDDCFNGSRETGLL